MPILQQNEPAAVARYTEFVTHSPYGNLMQDRGWAYVKKGWVGEQVYLEQNGESTGRSCCGLTRRPPIPMS